MVAVAPGAEMAAFSTVRAPFGAGSIIGEFIAGLTIAFRRLKADRAACRWVHCPVACSTGWSARAMKIAAAMIEPADISPRIAGAAPSARTADCRKKRRYFDAVCHPEARSEVRTRWAWLNENTSFQRSK